MLSTITLAGGCFWCLEAVYQLVDGITTITSGYSGGTTPNPTYEEVCTGATNHAEVVQLAFDPEQISLRKIFSIFFTVHDPTTLNRQGADVGTQYRSVIFYHDEEQAQEARNIIQELKDQQKFENPIVTRVEPLTVFYPAEVYHQNYFKRHPYDGYCRIVINPKVAKYQKEFGQKS